MGLKRAILYSLITLVSALSPSIADRAVGIIGIEFNSYASYDTLIIGIAIFMTVCVFIENYYLQTKTVVSGIFGLIKHLTYIAWTFFAFQAFMNIILPSSLMQQFGIDSPLVMNITYHLLLTLIMASLSIKAVSYLWQIAFYKDIQKPKDTSTTELKGKV